MSDHNFQFITCSLDCKLKVIEFKFSILDIFVILSVLLLNTKIELKAFKFTKINKKKLKLNKLSFGDR